MSETGMPSVTFPLPASHVLDNDEDHRQQKNGIQWTALEPVGGPGFCR